MGGNHSNHSNHVHRTSTSTQDFTNFINQKEYVFIAMQSDVDKAFKERNCRHIEVLANEIAAHLMDLRQASQQTLSAQEVDRVQKLKYSFEISFAKLKSVYSRDTSFLKKRKDLPVQTAGNSSFYSETDIVSDPTNAKTSENCNPERRRAPPMPLSPKAEVFHKPSTSSGFIRQGSITSERQSLPNTNNEIFTRSLPIHRQSLPNNEQNNNEFKLVEQISNRENPEILKNSEAHIISEIEQTYLDFLKRAKKPVKDINEYYQMDKTVFFLYTQLHNLEILGESFETFKIKHKKAKLLKDLVDFRGFLGKKAAEFREIEEAINVLDESIYINNNDGLASNTFKSEINDPNVPVTDLDEPQNKLENLSSNISVNFISSFENGKAELEIAKIESEFEGIKSKSYKPVKNVKEYYVIDLELSELYDKLKLTDTENGSELLATKNKLLNSILHFKKLLDKKVGQFEEIRGLEEDLNTLNIMFDSCLPNDFKNFRERANELNKRIENTTYPKHFEHKQDLFNNQIKMIQEQINLVEGENIVDESFEPIYGNFEEKPSLSSFEIIKSVNSNSTENDEKLFSEDHSKEENSFDVEDEDEPIYSNFEEIRQGITSQDLASIVSSDTEKNIHRDSVYSNIDIVKQHLGGSTQKLVETFEEHAKKPPRPLPRNYEEKLINDLSKHWKRLNEIYEDGKLGPKEVQEVENIKLQLEITRNLFQRKIEKIFENFEVPVNL